MKRFGRWLKAQLEGQGRSDLWLCHKTGLSNSTVTRYRVLGQQPRIDAFVAICEVLSAEKEAELDEMLLIAIKETGAYRNARDRSRAAKRRLIEGED
tara:strand:+ start:1011 stop:1301 length:291 start_codon:yes stop_codon:yes gene_type:complete